MPRDHRGDFGTFIGIHRDEKGVSGTVVGAHCNVTQSTVSNWETGKAIPTSAAQVRKVADILDIDPDRLVAIWEKDVRDRKTKANPIVTRSYTVTSGGGATTEDPY